MLTSLTVKNFRKFTDFQIDFNEEISILVGANDSGKSTVLHALEMAISGRLQGRPLEGEISQHWFPSSVTRSYCDSVQKNHNTALPELVIEAYLKDTAEFAKHRGRNNSEGKDVPGVRLELTFDPEFEAEYEAYVDSEQQIPSIPIEFYKLRRYDFAGNGLAGTRPLITCALIDASTLRLQSGTDYYLRKSIEEHLPREVRARMTLTLRAFRETLAFDPAFTEANSAMNVKANAITSSDLHLSPDSSSRNSWESTITPHMDNVPISQVGKGEQAAFKILLALEKSETPRHDVVLVEEPENHLTFAGLNVLVRRMRERSNGRQLILATHSSFVLNKLGLDNLKFMGGTTSRSLKELSAETLQYFEKLAGFDTLRLVLARAVILVEGPSDELIVQKAYSQREGRTPLEDGVDVITVQSLAFKRFLELARIVGTRTAVLTDLDDESSDAKARQRFSEFENDHIKGFVGRPEDGRTLEPQLVASIGLARLREVFGTDFHDAQAAADHMIEAKTEAALTLLQASGRLPMPPYIENAIDYVK